ncbi:MAG: hypothetical protein AUH42_02570 [Gemmatimonadetes bacterium 13_1_40CM_70_11]|nr:MAG: hypothetical protein AUH42_02570 [Gemmatimonadetes bacterium 13_1_40CM_70_11]
MNDDFAILLFWFGISVTANVALGIAWFRTSRRVHRLEARPGGQLEDLTNRFEQAVDSLTGRVEELANGQEFLNRVLSDRLDKLGRALPAQGSSP